LIFSKPKKLKLLYAFLRVIGKAINLTAFFSPSLGAKLALKLFCTPQNGRIKPHQASFLFGAEQKVIQIQQHSIQTYHWAGKGSRVLLLHGWENNTYRWKKLIKLLNAADFDIVAMDAPGHGASNGKHFDAYQYSKTIQAVCNYYQPEHIVAHSIAGFTAMYYLSHTGNAGIKSLISLAAPDRLIELTQFFCRLLGFNKRLMKAYDKEFTNYFPMPQQYYNASDFVKKLHIQGLIIHDENDALNKFSDGISIHKNWSNSEFIATKGLGHSLQHDTINTTIVEFLLKQTYFLYGREEAGIDNRSNGQYWKSNSRSFG
jgi:pimeloyl-ACP methyl ester carboxylesterase